MRVADLKRGIDRLPIASEFARGNRKSLISVSLPSLRVTQSLEGPYRS